MNNYKKEHLEASTQPDKFWLSQAAQLSWFQTPTVGFETDEQGNDRWFSDGEMNTAYLALDVHVENGHGDDTALIYDSPLDQKIQRFTYQELLDEVSKCAGMLVGLGVEKHDRVVIYMPMIPQAVIAMLACARVGAIHSVVFGGFAAKELAVRIDDAKPKVLLSATCGLELNKLVEYQPLMSSALELATHQPDSTVVWERSQSALSSQFMSWASLIEDAPVVSCAVLKATDPLYILYTSGTTGTPKGVVRDNGGHAVAMHYSMSALYNMKPGQVFWAASDVGWVVGHSYIAYAPLIFGCTTLMYEGKPIGTPDAGAFWRVVEQHRVNVLFAAPTAFRAIRKSDPGGEFIKKYDITTLSTVFMAGERLDPATLEWTERVTEKPVVDHWWQTETGWAIAGNPLGIETLKTKAGSACVPLPGYNVQVLDAYGEAQPANTQGFIAVKRPLPPGCLTTIWNNQTRFESGYLNQFPGYYVSGDGGYFDEEGYLFVMGRIDDVINVAGHRLSTGEMEAVLGQHNNVAECAVIGIHDSVKGQVPLGFVVLKDGVFQDQTQLHEELVSQIRTEIGAIACLKRVLVVDRLPKTRSGKILRATLRKIADGDAYVLPSTIDDPSALDDIRSLFENA